MQSLQANHSVVTECSNEWLDAEEDGSICLAQGWTIGKMFAKDIFDDSSFVEYHASSSMFCPLPLSDRNWILGDQLEIKETK